jgi:hypothetical protein
MSEQNEPQLYEEWPETSLLLRRHTLLFEGAVLGRLSRGTGGTGPGGCSCGERSPVLYNGAQRQRWHRRHKAAVAGIKDSTGA